LKYIVVFLLLIILKLKFSYSLI